MLASVIRRAAPIVCRRCGHSAGARAPYTVSAVAFDGEDDSKVDSPNSGKSEDSFTIDEIRAEFEGFDGF